MKADDGTGVCGTCPERQLSVRTRPHGAPFHDSGKAVVAKRSPLVSQTILSHARPRRGISLGESQMKLHGSTDWFSERHSESVREVYVFKHGFLSMRRIDAKSRKARAVLVRFSKSLASRRHLPSQANVLSTTHRLGMASKPTAASHRLTISVSRWGKIFFRARSNAGPWYPPSAKSFFRNGNLPNKAPRTRTPPSRSWILAGCAMACGDRPTASTRMWRFLPLIFLPAS